jgi:ATP-dependent DNA helicase RecG
MKSKTSNIALLDDNQILDLIGITKNGSLTLAGFLLFGIFPQNVFPQFTISAVIVSGTDYESVSPYGKHFLDNSRFDGPIKQMLTESLEYISNNMRHSTVIIDGIRNDVDEFPTTAVREAILNALMHRDYGPQSECAPIRIRLFYDRLEIISPGGLFGRFGITNIGKVIPRVRNTTLTRLLEDMGIAENRFGGIPSMRQEFRERGLPEPRFVEKDGDFIVTFYNEFSVTDGR